MRTTRPTAATTATPTPTPRKRPLKALTSGPPHSEGAHGVGRASCVALTGRIKGGSVVPGAGALSSRRPGLPGRLSWNRTSALHIRLLGTTVMTPSPAGSRPLLSHGQQQLFPWGSDVFGESPPLFDH